MSIDLKPAVGRFVFREPSFYGGYPSYAGNVTKVSGGRIYFVCGNYRETFLSKPFAFCDTQEECDLIAKQVNVFRLEADTMRKRQTDFFRQLIAL